MPRKNKSKSSKSQPIVLVLIPCLPQQKIDNDIAYFSGGLEIIPSNQLSTRDMTDDSRELMAQASATRARLVKYEKNKKRTGVVSFQRSFISGIWMKTLLTAS